VAIPPRPEFLGGGVELAKLGGPVSEIEILLTETQVEAWILQHAPRRDRQISGDDCHESFA
jgi:hypothetical protein